MIHHSLLSFTATFTRKHLEHSLLSFEKSPPLCPVAPFRRVPFVDRDDLWICVTVAVGKEARDSPFNRPRHVRRLFFSFFPLVFLGRGPVQRTGQPLSPTGFSSRDQPRPIVFFLASKTCHAIFTKGTVCRRFFLFLPFYNFTKIKPTQIGSFLRLHTRDSFKWFK